MAAIYEQSDAPFGTQTGYTLLAGDTFFGQLSRDRDWVGVQLEAGETYSFGLVGIGTQFDDLYDTWIELYTPQGQFLASDDDSGPGFSSVLTFTPLVTGRYFINVSAVTTGSQSGPYGLSVIEGARPSFGVEMGAAAMYWPLDYWGNATSELAATVSWGIRGSGPATDAQGNPKPFEMLTASQIADITTVMAQFSLVCGLTLEQWNPGGTSQDALILLGGYTSDQDNAAGYTYEPANRGEGVDVWLNNDSPIWADDPNSGYGSRSFFITLHEIGHALGLEHPGDYSAAPGVDITYANDAQFIEDSAQYTVMTYFRASNTSPSLVDMFPDTPMLYDIYALQMLYGVNTDANAGRSVYGFESTVGGAFDFRLNTDPLVCIWDGSGIDTLNLSGFSGLQKIDLRSGAFSDVGGYVGNLSIAFGANIENAIGGRGADTIIGNELANRLTGENGSDKLFGGDGNDTLTGGSGNDQLNGGAGTDRACYTGTADARVNLSLTGAQITGHGTDTLIGIEHIKSDRGNDRLTGNTLANTLISGDGDDKVNGGAGNDTILGGGGNDNLRGGAGSDVFVFNTALQAGNVDMIVDFNTVSDTIHLDGKFFSGLADGRLATTAFRSNATGLAADASDRIIYETDTGNLFFDADGNGAGAGIQFARISASLAVSNADFLVL